jgi:hypothetical protein
MNVTSANENWKDLYIAALSEPDESKFPMRIASAEEKIAARSRELSNSADHYTVEKCSLNIAFYALAALRNSLKADEADSRENAVA